MGYIGVRGGWIEKRGDRGRAGQKKPGTCNVRTRPRQRGQSRTLTDNNNQTERESQVSAHIAYATCAAATLN